MEEVMVEEEMTAKIENVELQKEAEEKDIIEPTAEDARLRRDSLLEEISSLEAELERKKEQTDREAKQYADFRELFPDADASSLPTEVLCLVNDGVPLAAAYALYEKRLSKRQSDAMAHNAATVKSGFGGIALGEENKFYTPDEVRAMSRDEVKANYQKIMESMKNWH